MIQIGNLNSKKDLKTAAQKQREEEMLKHGREKEKSNILIS